MLISFRRLFVPVAVALLLSAFTSPTAAIVGGRPDNNDHPYEALILVEEWGSCSGTLVSPTVIVTAGHCTFFFSDVGVAEVYVSFEPVPGVEFRDFVEDGVTYRVPYRDGGTWYTASTWVTHPDYVDEDWPFTPEIGIVILDAPVSIPFAELSELGVLDDLYADPATLAATRLTQVGYGVTELTRGGGPPQWSEDYVRKQRLTTGVPGGITETLFLTKNQPAPNRGGACPGDSGSGIFLGGSSTLVGIHIGGYHVGYRGVICGRASAIEYRLDTVEAQSFLAGFGVATDL